MALWQFGLVTVAHHQHDEGHPRAPTPPELAKEISAGVSGASLVVVPVCGHLSTIEKPDAVNSALAERLNA